MFRLPWRREHEVVSQQDRDDQMEAAFADGPSHSQTGIEDGDHSFEEAALVSTNHRRPSTDDDDATPRSSPRIAPVSQDLPYDRPSSPAPDYSFLRPPGSVPPSAAQPPQPSWRSRLTSAIGLPTRYDPLGTIGSGHAAAGSLTSRGGPAVGGGTGNDGVFANLVAKPERRVGDGGIEYVGGDDDVTSKEMPPVRRGPTGAADPSQSYETAASDSAPPYWETTVITPSGYLGPDDILVDGLPVGNIFGFAWNLLVSMSFQFVGFLLTYLLHTTHAAKNGSRAGLGITMIQWALYMRARAAQLQSELAAGEIPGSLNQTMFGQPLTASNGWSLFGSTTDEEGTVMLTPDGASGANLLQALVNATENGGTPISPGMAQAMKMSSMANDWLAWVLMLFGWLLILTSVLSFLRAIRWARQVRLSNAAQEEQPVIIVA